MQHARGLFEASLAGQIVNCRNCAEAMRIVAKALEPEGQELAMKIAESYGLTADMLEELKRNLGSPAQVEPTGTFATP